MPDDAVDLSITDEQRAWTLSMLQALGLKPAGDAEVPDPIAKVDIALVETYADRLEANKAAAEKVEDEKARLAELERELAEAEGQPSKQLELERLIRTQNEIIATHEAQAVDIAAAERVLFNLLNSNQHADEDLAKAQNELSDLLAMDVQAERPSSLKGDDKGKEDLIFAQAAKNTRGRIKLMRDVMKFTVNCSVEKPDGTTDVVGKPFPMISAAEASVLEKMVEVAEAVYAKKGFDAGWAKLAEVDVKLGEYDAAREGKTLIERPDGLDGRVEQPLDVVTEWADDLREKGYAEIANDLATKASAIEQDLQTNFGADDFDIEPLVARADALLKEGQAAKSDVDGIEEMMRKAAWLKRSVDQGGTPAHIAKAEEILGEFSRSGMIRTCQQSARSVFVRMKRLVEKVKKAQTAAQSADFDLDAERARITALEARYDDLFKHDKHGNVRMIEDSATGAMKGSKKNSKLPREVIRDLEVSIQKAKLRLESGATEVSVGATTDITALEAAFDRLDETPKLYKDLSDGFTKAEKELNKLDKKDAVYCTQERARLKIELDGLKKRKNEIDAPAVKTALDAFNAKVESHKADVEALKAKIARYEEQTKALRQKLSKIGSLSKDVAHLTNKPKVSGDYGKQAKAIAEIEAILAQPDPEKMKTVPGKLFTLSAELSEILAAFEAVKREAEGNGNSLPKLNRTKRRAEKSRRVTAATNLDEFKLVDGFMKQAGEAETAHNANMDRKTEFEEGAKSLLNSVKTAKKRLRKTDRNADMSAVDALVSEVDSLKSEIKKSQEYIDGCKRLKELKQRFLKSLSEVRARIEAGEEKLVDLAVKVVENTQKLERTIASIPSKIAAEAGAEYAPGGPYDKTKIEAFLQSLTDVLSAIPTRDMARAAQAVDNKEAEVSARKKSRAEALRVVRQLKEITAGSARLKHVASQPFEPAVAQILKTLRMQTSTLEVKLLTAMGKET